MPADKLSKRKSIIGSPWVIALLAVVVGFAIARIPCARSPRQSRIAWLTSRPVIEVSPYHKSPDANVTVRTRSYSRKHDAWVACTNGFHAERMVALVVHPWNVDQSGGPRSRPGTSVFSGSPEMNRRAAVLAEQKIVPFLRRLRNHGVQVVFVMPPRDTACRKRLAKTHAIPDELVRRSGPPPRIGLPATETLSQWRRWYSKHGLSPVTGYDRIDIMTVLEPKDGDWVVFDDDRLAFESVLLACKTDAALLMGYHIDNCIPWNCERLEQAGLHCIVVRDCTLASTAPGREGDADDVRELRAFFQSTHRPITDSGEVRFSDESAR